MSPDISTLEVQEKPWLTFLKQLGDQVQSVCDGYLEDGSVSWQPKELSPELVCVEIKYEEDGADWPVFHMFVSKRDFSRNMVRLHNTVTDESHVMQAEPKLILSWISF